MGPMSWSGMSCPNKIEFGRVHGPSAATGTVEIDGVYSFPLGSLQCLQIGAAAFYGIVVKNEVLSQETETDPVSRILLIDWRDRLHDSHFFCAFNMQEDDGRYYHILPEDWELQRKTYLIKEFDEADFQEIQEGEVEEIEVLKNVSLFSGFTLMNLIAETYSFVWTASSIALQILAYSRPENLDWNGGVKPIEAIEQICQRNGLQFTVFGTNQLYISLRGFSENAFVNGLVSGSVGICDVGGDNGSIGAELNERGRRAVIIGDHNRYEYIFPCKINWNTAWTFQFCYDGWTLNSLLLENELTLLNKVGEMPEAYHDNEKHNGKSRNELTIQEYLQEIAFHAYVVDGSRVVAFPEDFSEDRIEKEFGLTFPEPADTIDDLSVKILNREDLSPGATDAEWDHTEDPFNTDYNFHHSIANSLLVDSQLRMLAYCCEYLMIQGQESSFSGFKFFVPQDSGAKLDIESTINTETSREEFRVRVLFSDFRAYPSLDAEDKDALSEWLPDLPLVRLCLNGPLYRYMLGEQGNGIRVREQKRSVSNLFRGFFYNGEVSLLRANFLSAVLAGEGEQAITPVTADMIANRIATQMLFHEAINLSGGINYRDIAGMMVDGLIDTVNTGWSKDNGLIESVSFTTGLLDKDTTMAFGLIKQKLELKTEEDIRREFTIWSIREEMKKKATGTGKAGVTVDDSSGRPGGHGAAVASATLFGRQGTARVKVGSAAMGEDGIARGGVMIGRTPIA